MNTKKRYALIFTMVLLAATAVAAAAWAAPGELPGAAPGNTLTTRSRSPTVVAYQGEVQLSGSSYTGDGYFKFAVVNAAGDASYWSNDGSSIGGAEPTVGVELAVSEGLFGVLLGDTTLPGMTLALTADIFNQPETYLRVWFSASSGGTFSHLTPDTHIAAVPYALQAQEAANADTVDGLHANQLMTQPQNVVVVAKSGGDYTSVQAAIDSVSGESASNPYLVWVAQGVYEEQVTMKPYVHLQGAGQEATVISSTVSSSAWHTATATLILASDTSLRDLTVSNGGTDNFNVALLAKEGVTRTLTADVTVRAQGRGLVNYGVVVSGSGTGVRLQQVTALSENGSSNNFGLYNKAGAAVTLIGGSFTGRGGSWAHGIYNIDSNTTLEAENVTVLGENRFYGQSAGLYNILGAQATLRGGSFTASGATFYTRAIYNHGSDTTLEAESITTLGKGGINANYGLINISGAEATLRNSTFTGIYGGEDAIGIYNIGSGSTLEAENVTALGEKGFRSYGLYNVNHAKATLYGGFFTGRAGTHNYGIQNTGSGTTLEAEGITALGENGGNNNGLRNYDGATSNITQSVLEGATKPVLNGTGSVTVSNSRLVSPNPVDGTVTCVGVSRLSTFLTSGCP